MGGRDKDRGSVYPEGTDFMAIFSVTNFHYCILAVSTVFLSVTLFPMFSVPFCHCYVKLTSYGGFLSYSVAYDVSVDNVDRSLPSQFDLIIEVSYYWANRYWANRYWAN